MTRALALIALAACNTAPAHTGTIQAVQPVVEAPVATSCHPDEEPLLQIIDEIPAPAAKPERHVVIISEDGMRPDAIDERNAPNHIALMREGMIARRAFTVRPSETLPSHASMLSGFAVADHKMTYDGFVPARGQIKLPTLFSIAHDHGRSTAMFVGKKKLWHLAPTESISHYEKPGFLCKTVATTAARYFESSLPDVMFVHFTDPDNAGHTFNWMSPQYMEAVRQSDKCLRIILDAIDRSGAASSTLLIVTADHGGHGHMHSGKGKDLDRRIPWVMRGLGVPRRTLLDADVNTVDTARTALAALDLPAVPGMVGVSWFPPPPNRILAGP